MHRTKLLLWLLCALCLLSLSSVNGEEAGGVFFMGEDVLHPTGFVLTVNEFNRRPYQAGLGGQARLDEVLINLTMVNTGVQTFNIDPSKDFELELLNTFPASADQEGRATRTAFNVFPTTQSRIDLYFKVDAEQTVVPVLKFRLNESMVKIICDPELEKLLQSSEESVLSAEQATKLGQALINAGRYSAAEKIVRGSLEREPGNNQLLMQMASIEDANYNRENAASYLQQINPGNITSQPEAIAIARMAVNLGFYSLAIAVLEPFALTSRLETPQKLLLARAYYYENKLSACEQILEPIINSGSADQTAFFTMGNLFDKKSDLPKAIEYWEKAIEIEPAYAEAQFNLGVGYFKLKKIDKARECWERVLLLRPDSETMQAAEEALKATEF